MQRMVVVTNFTRLESASAREQALEVRPIDVPLTLSGAHQLLSQHADADVILLDGAPEFLYKLALARILRPRWAVGGPRLVALDLILNRPHNWKEAIKNSTKRLLLRNVDHFLHYFRDLSGYRRYFGISETRSTYVPFKVNGWEELRHQPPNPDGEYIFSSGRSLRDFETFAHAVEATGLPSVLTYHSREECVQNGTDFPPASVPANLRLMEDDGTLASWIEAVDRARVVVIPTLPDSIRAAGISLALVAMGLGKAVVMTEGVATRGIFDEELITVPPRDASALASAIRRAWNDDALRHALGQRARRHAELVGGNQQLDERIRDALWKIAAPAAVRDPLPSLMG